MSRRSKAKTVEVPPDPVYNSRLVNMTVRRIMKDGKKSLAAKILYDALSIIGERTGQNPWKLLKKPLRI